MAFFKNLFSTSKRQKPTKINKKINRQLSEEKAIKKEEQQKRKSTEKIEKIKQKILLEKKIISSNYNTNSKRLYANCAFLAQEILITEKFVSRIQKESNRPIVVIGNGGTGKPYTWSIKKSERLFIEDFNYPSTRARLTERTFEDFKSQVIDKHKSKNPIYIIVDGSRSNRMPSSLTGWNKDNRYTQAKESLEANLKKIKLKTAAIGYDWSMHNERKYLPHLNEIKKGKVDVILFNPLKSRGEFTINDKFWQAATHDDHLFMQKNLKKLTLLYTELLKERYL